MNILVINCGSSSIKGAVVDHESGKKLARLHIERVGETQPTVKLDTDHPVPCAGKDHEEALTQCLPMLLDRLPKGAEIGGVGHRVVHGGDKFSDPTRIDEDVVAAIEALVPLAPLHNPANLAGIKAGRKALPDLDHVAVFDTAFHATLPARARLYGIDTELADKHGIRRYGFHGTSHAFVARRAAEFLEDDVTNLRLITCHLGNGASVCAIEYGRSVETSMGMTPLEGLVMGTRCGDVDPGVVLHILRAEGIGPDEVDELLNRKSGLKGLSGFSNDMRDIEERAANGDERARMALHVYAHRVRKYIGAYAAMLGGVDAIVFTAGIGENSAYIRHRVARRLEFLGARLDEERNRAAHVDKSHPVNQISKGTSRTHLLVVATDEQHAIAQETAAIVGGRDRIAGDRPIPVAISARHIHLDQDTINVLFGPGHQLQPRNGLSQPGQYASEETLDVVGPKRTIKGVRVLGPPRSRVQVEVVANGRVLLGHRRTRAQLRRHQGQRRRDIGRSARTGASRGRRDLRTSAHPHDAG